MALFGAALGLVGGAIQVFYWEVMEAVRPKGSQTAALGWLWSVEGSLMALGSALGGYLSETFSPTTCFGYDIYLHWYWFRNSYNRSRQTQSC